MKKFIVACACVAVVLFAGCEKVADEKKVEKGDYKVGTYYGTAVDSFGGAKNTASAVVTVDDNGLIVSVFLDTTYTKDGISTTKKALKEGYGMRVASPIKKEWYEQAEAFEKKVIEKQGIDFITWKDAEKTSTDSISGTTMKVNALYAALSDALVQAK